MRVEGKYELGPGVYCALRYGRIDYGYIDDGQAAWDYGIQRIETGFGYYLDRRTRLKALVQLNSWAGAPDESDHLVSLQLASVLGCGSFSACSRAWLMRYRGRTALCRR